MFIYWLFTDIKLYNLYYVTIDTVYVFIKSSSLYIVYIISIFYIFFDDYFEIFLFLGRGGRGGGFGGRGN